ncbi:MAG TPA: PP2C family protein-serine/threonine phosphatase [Acidimicrobiales bacterium]|nr:PP2C family protein-serine/threonine phosphatase [Acidimicrobiales bacterium]
MIGGAWHGQAVGRQEENMQGPVTARGGVLGFLRAATQRSLHHEATMTTDLGAGESGAYAQIAALLHESRDAPPDQLGSFLGERAIQFGMQDLTVYVADFEQRHLMPIPGSVDTIALGMDDSIGGRSYSRARQLDEVVDGGVRLWSVVVDGAARLGVFSVVFSEIDDERRSLANSLAGVIAALLVTRGQCTDAYTTLRRSQKLTLAAEMQWDLLPPLSLDSGRVSVAGLIQPAYEVGGDSFDYALNGNILEFGVFDAMGHGLGSSQLAHLAVTSYRHSRRSHLNLEATYELMDEAVRGRGWGDVFVTCILGRLDITTGELQWINVGHPAPLLIRGGEVVLLGACEPTLPAGLGDGCVTEISNEIMNPGDRLCCITDGVLDAHRPGGEDFGEERVRQFLAESTPKRDTMETVRQLTHTVLDHHGYLSDDCTVFLIEYR